MKKLFLFIMPTLIFLSCGKEYKPTYVEEYTKQLVLKHPNFETNEIAKSAIRDSIKAHITPFIGKHPKDIEGVKFRFEKLIEGKNGYCALFTATQYTDIENPSESGDKYINATIQIIAFGNIDDTTASSLDAHKYYELSGVLHSWDEDNSIPVIRSTSFGSIDFGTYILDDMTIKEVPNE